MNKRKFVNIFMVALQLILATAPAAGGDADKLLPTLEAQLNYQSEAWNQGDLQSFTSIYTENAKFISPSGMTAGRNEVLARYARKYPDREAMGQLKLEILSVLPLGCRSADGAPCAASVIAKWTLRYPEDAERQTVSGLTLLVFVQQGKKWRIAQDASM